MWRILRSTVGNMNLESPTSNLAIIFSMMVCGGKHRITFHVGFYGYFIKNMRAVKKKHVGMKIADNMRQYFKN